MQSVLGVDAAWTTNNPSGCALVTQTVMGWRLGRCSASYDRFIALSGEDRDAVRPRGSAANVGLIIAACVETVGRPPDLVAVDMPMAKVPITARRRADDEISRRYAGRGAGTHTPSGVRPGKISDDFRAAFEAYGYPLKTENMDHPALIEVYPHPALIELLAAPRRLPYKAGKGSGSV